MIDVLVLALDEFIAKYPLTDLADIALKIRKELLECCSSINDVKIKAPALL